MKMKIGQIGVLAVSLFIAGGLVGCNGGTGPTAIPTTGPTAIPTTNPTTGGSGTRTTAQIGTNGGSVEVPNVAKATFPAGAFSATQTVTVAQVNLPSLSSLFNETTDIFNAGAPVSYQVTVNTGRVQPKSNTFSVFLRVPDAFLSRIPAGHGVEMFILLRQRHANETLDTWELFPSQFDAAAKTLQVDIPSFVLAPFFSSDGTNEVTLTVAATPGSRQSSSVAVNPRSIQTRADGTCQAVSLSPPLATMTVQEGFGELRRDSDGFYKLHWGVDLVAPIGTSVKAALSGTVLSVNNAVPGYGKTVVLQHGGAQTMYAHLSSIKVTAGTPVTAGAEIGLSGVTGNANTNKPHLHFELSPSGDVFQKKNKVDPIGCVGNQAQGDVLVRDNGNVADDAFAVLIDGKEIGRTAIGASNNLATGQLRLGDHTLRLNCLTAPDDVGTYEIILSGNTVFKTGNKNRRSGTLPQGGTVEETIVVFGTNNNLVRTIARPQANSVIEKASSSRR